MDQFSSIILSTLGLFWLFVFCAFSLVSYREGERRAARVSILVAICGATTLFLSTLLPSAIEIFLLLALGLLSLIGLILFVLPIGIVSLSNDTTLGRYDERDIMFARARLEPGSPEYQSYYLIHPDKLAIDEHTRAKPGLLSPKSKLADPYLFTSSQGSFFLTEALRDSVEGPVSDKRLELPPSEMTQYLKDLVVYYGGLSVGVTPLQPYHVYSHIGRGNGVYGDPITIEHHYAIAFTVEMDFNMMGTSPHPPVVMESARQYVESARIAVQLAAAIRALGYNARAHIDGNYRVIAPLVGRDAGLGKIGRMGLLMTPTHGPRVRLGVVTTDLDLIPDKRRPDPSMIDFCMLCLKCAENCPSRSIPFGERQVTDSGLRWKINAETCFHYWNVIGTDCGRCMAVCPYSHPSTISHNIVRWGNRKSGAFRRLANWFDNLFYGRYPAQRGAPEWTKLPKNIKDL